MYKYVLVLLGALVIGAITYVLIGHSRQLSGRLLPPKMPAVVDANMDAILASLERELKQQRPDFDTVARPGITPQELQQATAAFSTTVHPDMQRLYQWHNGLTDDAELFPGHTFWSLEEALQTNKELTADYAQSGFSELMAEEATWLTLFPDGAGDGYYYDPKYDYASGGVFYNFREIGYYMRFPSIKNLLMAIVECYQAGVYRGDTVLDYKAEQQIMQKYGLEVPAP
jgi:hypothetical protein